MSATILTTFGEATCGVCGKPIKPWQRYSVVLDYEVPLGVVTPSLREAQDLCEDCKVYVEYEFERQRLVHTTCLKG